MTRGPVELPRHTWQGLARARVQSSIRCQNAVSNTRNTAIIRSMRAIKYADGCFPCQVSPTTFPLKLGVLHRIVSTERVELSKNWHGLGSRCDHANSALSRRWGQRVFGNRWGGTMVTIGGSGEKGGWWERGLVVRKGATARRVW